MFLILVALFILLPVLELKILWSVGNSIGIAPTLGLVVVTGIAGSWLARRQGIKVISDINADLQAGRLPADNIIGGALVLAGGVMLITPGIITDCAGLLLMLPPVRSLLAGVIRRRLGKRIQIIGAAPGIRPGAQPEFYPEGELRETQATVIEENNEP